MPRPEPPTTDSNGHAGVIADIVERYIGSWSGAQKNELARACGWASRDGLDEMLKRNRKTGTPPALDKAQGLLAALRMSPADTEVFLRESGLLGFYKGTAKYFREHGILPALTARTGLTASSTLQWLMTERMRLERKYLVDNLHRARPMAIKQASTILEKWEKVLHAAKPDTETAAEQHKQFHKLLIDAILPTGGDEYYLYEVVLTANNRILEAYGYAARQAAMIGNQVMANNSVPADYEDRSLAAHRRLYERMLTFSECQHESINSIEKIQVLDELRRRVAALVDLHWFLAYPTDDELDRAEQEALRQV